MFFFVCVFVCFFADGSSFSRAETCFYILDYLALCFVGFLKEVCRLRKKKSYSVFCESVPPNLQGGEFRKEAKIRISKFLEYRSVNLEA